MFAATDNPTFMEEYLPYLVLATGLIAFALFLAYFMSDTDRRKRITGTILTVLLAGFSIFCITEGEGVKRGIDLKGGASFLVRVQPSEGKEVNPDALGLAQSIIEKRLNPTGGRDVTITPQGTDRLYVEVPGLTDEDIRRSEEVIEKVAKLEFRLLHQDSIGPDGYVRPSEGEDKSIKPGFDRMRYLDRTGDEKEKEAKPGEPEKKPDKWVWVKNRAEMSGKSVAKAWPELQPGAIHYNIAVVLHDDFAEKMDTMSRANLQKPMAIVLDGEVMSAPRINSVLGARFEITGSFTDKQARDLASQLMNPLENPLKVEQKSTISPTYGEETVRQGIMSTMLGLALTLLFLMLYYRLSGVIAVIGLVVNLMMLLGAMRIFDQTLTMPGIAGIILSLGMAVDANVLIYERMREEFQAGRNLSAAIPASYDKAFSAIFDSNVTTLITSAIMIAVATGTIQGFGLALSIGLICSMFSALLITRVCFLWLHRAGLQKLTFMSLIKNRLHDFMGKRKLWITISTVLCVACVAMVAVRGKNALGYELRGGDMISLEAKAGITIGAVNQSLADWSFQNDEGKFTSANINVGTVKPVDAPVEYITIRSTPGTSASIKEELIKDLAAADPAKIAEIGNVVAAIGTTLQFSPPTVAAMQERITKLIAGGDSAKVAAVTNASTESMGSSVGGEMLVRSIWALALGFVGIFIYLTFRFEMPFAIGGLVAIIHDVIVAVGVCALAGKEIGLILIGAFLTIAGFSINDTIVIFDRVRENLRTMKGDLEQVLNHAISATLSRTIITSGITMLGVLAMLVFGGKAMADFSFAMLVGMVSGVYSTIFIASPVVLWWANKRKVNLRQQIIDADAARLEALSGIEREAPAKAGK
jgi:SecD/SecF fusion protein